jgi:glutamate carboxypeptidase
MPPSVGPPWYSRGIMTKTLGGLICLLGLACVGAAQQPLTAPETSMVKAVDAEAPAAVALLEKIVDINSGTMNLPGVVKVKDVVEPEFVALGFKTKWVPMDQLTGRAGDLIAEHPCSLGSGKCGKRLLLIGHMDTVFELSSTFQKYAIVPGTNGHVATGPGTADMKGGLVVMLSALKALKAAGALDTAEIMVVLSGDEERHGNPVSIARRDMIDAARHSDVALEFENASRTGGVDGRDAVRIGRRSAIPWKLEVTGKTGHSSGVFGTSLGYGAIYELARILDQFRTELTEPGLTYNVGLVLGGATAERNADDTGGTATGKTNVVPPAALANGDLRTLNEDQTVRIKGKMEAIVRDHLPDTSARIVFDEGYPAMGATPASEALLAKLQDVNQTLGYAKEDVTDPVFGGAGDIAFVAPYIPGLVGVGAMGAGAHAEGETVYLDSLPIQAKRMAVLMYRLSNEK